MMLLTLGALRPYIIFETAVYDGPLRGLARVDRALYAYDVEEIDGDPVRYVLTPLTGRAKRRALVGKLWFEICIGTYWSHDRKNRHYHPRYPRWLKNLLWDLYYGRRPVRRYDA